MSLIDPGVGDILDRLSILTMKPKAPNFEAETRMLMERLMKRLCTRDLVLGFDLDKMLTALLVLATTNGRIWELTDIARTDEGIPYQVAVELNHQRRAVVEKLNELL